MGIYGTRNRRWGRSVDALICEKISKKSLEKEKKIVINLTKKKKNYEKKMVFYDKTHKKRKIMSIN